MNRIALVLSLASLCLYNSAGADSLKLVTTRSPSLDTPTSGNGDSYADSLSPDGRFVLFASTAINLVSVKTNQPIPAIFPTPMNVFLRDRTLATTALVSVDTSGDRGGNAGSAPAGVSTNGQYALFESNASNLVADDTNDAPDIFLRDLAGNTTLMVSVATNGAPGNGPSRSPVMTPDGRYIAFVSEANNLVPGDTNQIADIFVRDLKLGVTTLVSAGAMSAVAAGIAGSGSETPQITPDGRYVAFYSTATNLYQGVPTVSGTRIYGDLYVRDLVEGKTTWVSAGARAALLASMGVADGFSFSHCLSEDGQVVSYEASPLWASSALVLRYSLATGTTDLIYTNATAFGGDYAFMRNIAQTPNGRLFAFTANLSDIPGYATCILVWDEVTQTLSLASEPLINPVPEDSLCDSPAIDASGRFVAFLSDAVTLVTNQANGDFHVYVRDRQNSTTALIDSDAAGRAAVGGVSTAPCLSADGRFIAFECLDSALVRGDFNGAYDVFVKNLSTEEIELVSLCDPGLASVTPDGRSDLTGSPVSLDGRRIVFSSNAGDLVANDQNDTDDIFVRDLVEPAALLVSVNTNGVAGNSYSYTGSISADGRLVAFCSLADDLVPGDTNRARDVFVRDLQGGTTALVSVSTNGLAPGDKESFSPWIAADGKSVVFQSRAANLATASYITTFGSENLFLRDLQAAKTYALTTQGAFTPWTATPDARRIAFSELSSMSSSSLFVWDQGVGGRIYTNKVSGLAALVLSSDGTKLAYATNGFSSGEVRLVDFTAGTNRTVAALRAASRPGFRFSTDGQLLTFAAAASAASPNQVYLADLQTQTVLLLSKAYQTGAPANGHSDMPDISGDGRFVAYRSEASDLVPGDTNGVPDIFLYDRLHAATSLVTASHYGSYSADNRSLTPVFSGDGQTLVFVSWASDLAPRDFNGWSDVFALSLYSSASIPLYRATLAADSQGCFLTWPAMAGKSYRVQFKTDLSNSQWQDLAGQVAIVGGQGFVRDPSPAAAQRYYRVVAD